MIQTAKTNILCSSCGRIVIHWNNSYDPSHYFKRFDDGRGVWVYYCSERCKDHGKSRREA